MKFGFIAKHRSVWPVAWHGRAKIDLLQARLIGAA